MLLNIILNSHIITYKKEKKKVATFFHGLGLSQIICLNLRESR
jgi:hypothetical protein